MEGVSRHYRELDVALQPFLDRTMEEVDAIERAMLRISAYELQHRPDVPYRVVIDEALRSRALHERPAGPPEAEDLALHLEVARAVLAAEPETAGAAMDRIVELTGESAQER